jgi:hypothetical protein
MPRRSSDTVCDVSCGNPGIAEVRYGDCDGARDSTNDARVTLDSMTG